MPAAMAHRDQAPATETVFGLDEAITRLEGGNSSDDITVDLGDGRLARANGHRGETGLLQRLKAHRLIMALGDGPADLTRFASEPRPLFIAPQVQEILNAIRVKPAAQG